jgi:hypothetical protein
MVWTSILKKLLNNIVAEDISHQGKSRGQNLFENKLFVSIIRHFQSLLDESRAVLVLAESDDMTYQITYFPLS